MLAVLLLAIPTFSAPFLLAPTVEDPAPPALSPADAARAQFAADLDEVHAKLRKREWKAADSALRDLLASREHDEIARGKLLELEEIARLSAFWAKHPAPEAKTLLYGDLTLFDRATDVVKLAYTPGRLAVREFAKSKRKPIAVAAFDTGEKPPFPPYFPDFEQVGQLTLHPLQFNGPYTVEIKGRMPAEPQYVPSFVFLLDGDEYLVASFEDAYELKHLTEAGAKSTLLKRDKAGGLELGEEFVVQVAVTDTTITIKNKGRPILSGPKPKGRFGWFGTIALQRVTSFQMSGKSYGQWLDSLVDSAVQTDRDAFDATFDVRSILPAWLYDVPNKAVRDAEGEEAAVRLVQVGVSAPLLEQWKKLTAARKWTEMLAILDAADERSIKPLPRAWTRAQVLFQLERFADARAAAREVVAAAPKHKEMRMLDAAVTARLDGDEPGIAAMRAFVGDFPEEVQGRELLVTLLVRAGRLDDALHEAESGFAAGVDRAEMTKLVRMTRRAVAGPTWRTTNRFESKHYTLASDMDRDTCVQLSKVLEETYAFLERAVGPVPAGRPRMRVFVFSGKQAYSDYCEDLVGQSMNKTQGLYASALSQLLFWNAQDREDFVDTARHEAFHQFVDEFVREVPLWLNEGLAQYFQHLRKEKNQLVAGAPRPEVRTLLQGIVASKTWPDFERLFAAERDVFYGEQAEAWYAMSWCVVHALAHGDPQDRRLFDGLISRLAKGVDGALAVRETFEGVDLAALRERVIAHVAKY